MNVSLLQITLDRKARAGNLVRVTDAIVRAARSDSTPDLLILPGSCDTGGGPPGRDHSDGFLANFRATIASKAREWGLYIAAGLHIACETGHEHCGVLFDPDGDLVAVGAAQQSGGAGGDGRIANWATVIGTMAVCTTHHLMGRCLDSAVPKGALVAVPVSVTTTGGTRRDDERCVESLLDDPAGAYWALVSPVVVGGKGWRAGPATTFLAGPDGRVLIEARLGIEETVSVRLDLEPALVD